MGDVELVQVARDVLLGGMPYNRLMEGGKPATEWCCEVKTPDGLCRLSLAGRKEYGLPYGKDRVVLAWFQTLAKRSGSRVIQWRHATEFFKAFGLEAKGHYQQFYDSCRRLISTSLLVTYEGKYTRMKNIPILEEICIPNVRDLHGEHSGIELLDGMSYGVALSETVWDLLQKNPVPLNLDLIKNFQRSPLEWQLVSFICFRVGSQSNLGWREPVRVSWVELKEQLKSDSNDNAYLKKRVRQTLAKLRDYWPQLNAELRLDGVLEIRRPTDGVQPVPRKVLKDTPKHESDFKRKRTKNTKEQSIGIKMPVQTYNGFTWDYWRGCYGDHLEVVNEVDWHYQHHVDQGQSVVYAIERAKAVGDGLLDDIEKLDGNESELQKFLTSLRARQARRGGDQVWDIVRRQQGA